MYDHTLKNSIVQERGGREREVGGFGLFNDT